MAMKVKIELIIQLVNEIHKDGELNSEEIQDWINRKEEKMSYTQDSEVINSLVKDELGTVDTDEEVRKPAVKYDDTILAFNMCIDWATKTTSITSSPVVIQRRATEVFNKYKQTKFSGGVFGKM